jgi:adenosylhomocysteine nucleosidase
MIVAVASDGMEFTGWLRHCKGVRKLDWPVDFARQAEWNGQALTMVANGAGPRLAAAGLAAARERETVSAVMSIGWCGALDPALRLNDVFVALGVRTEAGDRAALAPRTMPAVRRGVLWSGDRFIRTASEKAALRERGADAVEMEADGLRFGGSFYAVRVVSDLAAEDFSLDFNRYRDADGRFQKARIALAGMRHPGDLLRMARRGREASEALGDFLAQCEL